MTSMLSFARIPLEKNNEKPMRPTAISRSEISRDWKRVNSKLGDYSKWVSGFMTIFPSLLLALMSGCAPFAPLTQMPTVNASENDLNKKYPIDPKYYPIPRETTIEGIRLQLSSYEATWAQAAEQISVGNFALNELKFYGSIAAAVGGIAKAPGVAIAGTGVAGGSSLLNDHYALKAQAVNYTQAADTVRCIHGGIDGVSDDIWQLYNKNGTLLLSKKDFEDNQDQEAADGYDKLADLIPNINDNIAKVVSILRKAQENVAFITPSVSDITKAISASAQAQNTASAQAPKVANKLQAVASSVRQGVISPGTTPSVAASAAMVAAASPEQAAQAASAAAAAQVIYNLQAGLISAISRALKLPSDMDTCVTALGK
jgi:hypothetical protein